MFKENFPQTTSDEQKSREALIRELANLRSDLDAEKRLRREQAQELARLEDEASSANDQRYRRLFDAMREAFAFCESIPDEKGNPVDYRFLEVNEAFGSLTGISPEAVRGRTAREVFPRIDPVWIEFYGRVASSGKPAHFERYAADSQKWIETYAFSPEPGRFCVSILDITRRKRAEEALLREKSLLQEILQHIPIGVVIADSNGRIIFCNQALREMHGPEFHESRNVSEYARWNPHRPDGSPCEPDRVPMARALRGESVRGEAMLFPRPGGAWMHVSVNASPLYGPKGEILFGLLTVEDVSDLKEAERAMRKGEQHLRDVLDNMVAMIGVMTPDGALIEANRTALEAADLKPEDVLGKPFEECYWWAWSPEVQKRLREAILRAAGGDGSRYDETIRVGENAFRTIDFMLSPMFDAEGRVSYLIPSATDITERKRAEEQLRTTLESIGDGFIACDESWRLVYVNSPAERLLGIRREEVIGKNHWEVFPLSLGTPLEEEYRRAAAGEIRDFENFYAPWNRWFHNRCFPRDGGGISVYFQDITDRKRMEEALRKERELFQTIFASIPVMLTVYDPGLNMTHINHAVYDITGWTPADVREKGIMALVYPDPAYRTKIAEYMQSLRPGFKDIHMTCKNGEVRVTSWANIRISDGRQVGIGVDITERKAMEETLKQVLETLEQRVAEGTRLAEARAKQLQYLAVELIEAEERERERISEILHDDLQQLLASARLQLQVAAKGSPAQPALAPVERLLEESIDKSRRLSHELSPAVLHHSNLSEALAWLARQMGEQFGMDIRLSADETHPVADATLKTFLFRAMQELLFNVHKHSGVKAAEVTVSGDDGNLRLTISDGGKGFDPAILNPAASKTGLGLLSLRERARSIGGSFDMESGPHRGSRFILTVPLSLTADDETTESESSTDHPSDRSTGMGDAAGAGEIRVLFADDHRVMRQGLISLIEDQPDIRVVGEAENGLEALAMARRLRPDLIVMDVTMPEMDGVEATRRIKAELPAVRVIGLSMFADDEIGRTMREAGAEAFVSKTASSGELLEAIYGMTRPRPDP
jgi:PAS domain S-box-containing protein